MPSKFSTRSGLLPSHGTIPLAVPFSGGHLSWVPRGFRFLTHASIDLSIQCACDTALFFFNILPGGVELFSISTLWLGTQQSRVLCKGRLIKVHFSKLLLHKESVGPSGHTSPSGQSLGCGRLGLHDQCHSQGIQMSNSPLGPFVSELSRHLHFVSGFLESPLVGHDIYHVAGPGVYAHQLVDIAK